MWKAIFKIISTTAKTKPTLKMCKEVFEANKQDDIIPTDKLYRLIESIAEKLTKQTETTKKLKKKPGEKPKKKKVELNDEEENAKSNNQDIVDLNSEC